MGSDTAASFSLIIARIVYGINWFNVSAVFPLIALEFNKDVSLLGSITTAFLIGVGLFQIPAGIFAAKYGPRTSAIFGITTSSIAAVLYGLASEASQLVWLRFIVGLGMAFFFSSAIILIARYGKRGFPGFSIGMMNSAHSMGGIIGIFAWIIIAQILGWRNSLILSGVLGLVTASLIIMAVPKADRESTNRYANRIQNKFYKPRRQVQLKFSIVLRILSNRPLVYLGLVLIGIQAAWALELTFIVVYLRNLGFSAELTGIIASLPLISSIVSAPLIGGFYDQIKDARKVLMICGIGMSMAIAGMSIDSIYIVIICTIFIGFFSGGAFTVIYEKARTIQILDIAEHKNKTSIPKMSEKDVHTDNSDALSIDSSSYYFDAIKVAWVNGLSLIGVLWMPIVFSSIVTRDGYDLAWILSGVVTALFVLIPLSRLSKPKRHVDRPSN
jgi:predicted MFS family arabinose efflux permease